jgi:hypothetical protein
MKNTKVILLIVVNLFVLSGCQEHCLDTSAHFFTEIDYAYFSFKQGDTSFFKDIDHDEIFYLACMKKLIKIDSTYYPDENCIEGGSYHIAHLLYLEFVSNLPHFNTNTLELIVGIKSKGEYNSFAEINFTDVDHYSPYTYNFEFSNETEILFSFTNLQPVIDRGLMTINGKEFNNVYSISFSDDGGLRNFVYYDTLYYNKQGFLKFISSQYGHRLEILE